MSRNIPQNCFNHQQGLSLHANTPIFVAYCPQNAIIWIALHDFIAAVDPAVTETLIFPHSKKLKYAIVTCS